MTTIAHQHGMSDFGPKANVQKHGRNGMVDVWQRNNTRSCSKQRQTTSRSGTCADIAASASEAISEYLAEVTSSIIPLAARAPERPGSSDRMRIALQKIDRVALR